MTTKSIWRRRGAGLAVSTLLVASIASSAFGADADFDWAQTGPGWYRSAGETATATVTVTQKAGDAVRCIVVDTDGATVTAASTTGGWSASSSGDEAKLTNASPLGNNNSIGFTVSTVAGTAGTSATWTATAYSDEACTTITTANSTSERTWTFISDALVWEIVDSPAGGTVTAGDAFTVSVDFSPGTQTVRGLQGEFGDSGPQGVCSGGALAPDTQVFFFTAPSAPGLVTFTGYALASCADEVADALATVTLDLLVTPPLCEEGTWRVVSGSEPDCLAGEVAFRADGGPGTVSRVVDVQPDGEGKGRYIEFDGDACLVLPADGEYVDGDALTVGVPASCGVPYGTARLLSVTFKVYGLNQGPEALAAEKERTFLILATVTAAPGSGDDDGGDPPPVPTAIRSGSGGPTGDPTLAAVAAFATVALALAGRRRLGTR